MERKPEEKKGIFTKLKENIDDHDEQMQVLGAAAVSYTHLTLPTKRIV